MRCRCSLRFKVVDMRRELTITTEPINESALISKRALPTNMGAAIYFIGAVRDSESGTPIKAIQYEAFEKMVRHQFELLFAEIEKRWPIESIRLVHRIGRV